MCRHCGIDSQPVWLAWGKALILLGMYAEASEKIEELFRVSSSPRPATGSFAPVSPHAVVDELIDLIESAPQMPHNLFEKACSGIESVYSEHGQHNPNANAYDPTTAARVRKLLDGKLTEIQQNRTQTSPKSCLDTTRIEQCAKYIERYSTPEALLRFYMRHLLVRPAISLILLHNLEPSVFVEHVVIPAAECGEMKLLLSEMTTLDSSLDSLRALISAAAKHLLGNRQYNLLYELHVACRNYAAAAEICVTLFGLVSDFSLRVNYLGLAKEHFQRALAVARGQQSGVGEAAGASVEEENIAIHEAMSEGDIARQLNTVELQLEVTKWFEAQMPAHAMSLFGTNKMKCDTAEILLPHNFPLAQRIMVDFRLPHVQICGSAVNGLARTKQNSKINELLGNLKGKLSDRDWDLIVSGVIEVFARELKEESVANKFIKYLKSDHAKFTACVKCGKFKAAYQLATQQPVQQALQDIAIIKTEAQARLQENRDDAGSVEALKRCNWYIQTNQRANPS
eukprot:c7009_g1_i2.p1 GENE.c7009_g1_i2~~c7009_g1_i2.p1  ORF type:complete len:512 (-),score=114.32 c7009_g1_i2:1091-2626(-)